MSIVKCQMYDLITIGDVTIDLFFKGKTLTEKEARFNLAIGGKYLADEFHESLGGGGANVAAGVAHHGLNAAVLGKIGENVFKQIIIQKLIRCGVSTEFLLYDKGYLNISAIFLSQEGDRTVVHYATPHESLDVSEIMHGKLLRCKMIYMGNLPGISVVERKGLLSFFKKNNMTIALNFGRKDLGHGLSSLTELINLANIIILNTFEFAELIGKKRESLRLDKDIAAYLPQDLKPMEKIILITDGENGSFCYHQGKILHQKAIKPEKLVDATGAGDAFTSGFLSSYIKDIDLEKAMQTGAKNAARILAKIGAQ